MITRSSGERKRPRGPLLPHVAALMAGYEPEAASLYPRTAASIFATSIFSIGIIA